MVASNQVLLKVLRRPEENRKVRRRLTIALIGCIVLAIVLLVLGPRYLNQIVVIGF